MKRREFIKKAGAAALISTSISSTAFAADKKHRWRMSMAVPKTSPIWGPSMLNFAKRVEELTSGTLKIRVYGAGELVPALATIDAVSSGEIQMGHAASYYWQGKIPATPFFCSVPFGMNVNATMAWLKQGGGQELWEELMAPYKVISFPCGSTGYQSVGWYNKEINSVEDFKGLKIRIPGLAGNVYAKLGAKPTLIPGGEIFTSLSTGVVDAVEWTGPYADYLMGFQKAAKYFYGGSWHEPGAVLELMINKAAWEEISEQQRGAVKAAAAETHLAMLTEFEAKNAEYLAKIKSEGKIQLKNFSVPVLKKIKEVAEGLKKEIGSTSPLAGKIYQSYTDFQNQYEAYHREFSEKNIKEALT